MPDQLDEAIRQNAIGPKSASGDAGSMEQHLLPHQLAVDRYLESKKAMKRGRGFRVTKVVPSGAV